MPTTITVKDSTLERFKRLKGELDDKQNAPNHTNESFLQSLMDTWEAADDGYYSDPSADNIVAEIKDQLDTLAFQGALTEAEAERLMNSLKTIEERTGRLEQQFEALEGRR